MEYEIIHHDQIQGVKLFLNDISYRTPHMHREFELILVLSGMLIVSCLDEQVFAEPGELIILNPWQTHELRTRDCVAACLILQVSPEAFRGFFPAAGRIRFRSASLQKLSVSTQDELHRTMLSLGQVYFAMAPLYEFVSVQRLNRIFELLLRYEDWTLLTAEQTQHEALARQRLERIMQYVQANFQQKLYLKQLAEQEHLSESYLTHFIPAHLNMSFQDYVALTRFQHARQLLENTELSIEEISRECGFSDRRYLTKICLQETGMTPKEFRRAFSRHTRQQAGSAGASQEHIYTDAEALSFLEQLEQHG